MTIEEINWLKEGEFTGIDSNVRKLARQLHEEIPYGTRFLQKVGNFLSKLKKGDYRLSREFRRRNGSQIAQDKNFTEGGCTDKALVFLVLARERRMPCKYVETFYEPWLQEYPETGPIQGHVFTDIFLDGQWRSWDPQSGPTNGDGYSLGDRRYVEAGKGLDFSGVYLKINGVYQPHPRRLQTRGELLKAAREIKADIKERQRLVAR